MNAWIDGRSTDMIPLDDRGLNYGDGVFETIAVREGVPLRLERHLRRMAAGLERLGFRFDAMESLKEEATRACKGRGQAVLKLIVTRGSGDRGYRPPEPGRAVRIIRILDWPAALQGSTSGGLSVRVCTQRLAIQPALAGIKHLNRLEQVLARAEWHDMTRWQEGLMLDTSNHVIGGTQSNLFMVHDGRISTPSLTGCGIAGIMRGVIIEQSASALDLEVEVTEASLDRVERSDELFLCNSVMGIRPVATLQDRAFYAPGPVTRRISEWFQVQDG